MLDKIKKMLKRDKGDKQYPVPYEFLRVNWVENVEDKRVQGDDAKVIQHIRRNKVIKEFPYSRSKLIAMKESLKLPVYDKLGNLPRPDYNTENVVNPIEIEDRRL